MSGLVIQDRELNTARFEPIAGEEFESALRELRDNNSYASSSAQAEPVAIQGQVHVVLRNGDGEIKHESLHENLVTLVGNQYYGERAANVGTPPAQATGMRLGTGTTAVAATGAGA